MTYFEDLSSCEAFADPDVSGQILAVGWLERDCAYQRGLVQEEVVDILVKLLIDPWQPVASAGWHDCPFCCLSRGPRTLMYKKHRFIWAFPMSLYQGMAAFMWLLP